MEVTEDLTIGDSEDTMMETTEVMTEVKIIEVIIIEVTTTEVMTEVKIIEVIIIEVTTTEVIITEASTMEATEVIIAEDL